METHMSFEQFSDVLTKVYKAHEEVFQYCKNHESDFESDQRQMLLATLREDQQHIQSTLDDFRTNSPSNGGAKDWIQFVPQRQLNAGVNRIKDLDSASFDDLTDAISNFYEVIGSFIERIKEQTASAKARDMLNDLAFLENHYAKALALRLAGLRDV
jgi:hypothetical protein